MRKDCVARELSREIVVGAFMVMILLGLGYFTIILSREAWFSEQTTLEVVFKDVMGLREGDSVVARGMPIGKVQSLDLKADGVHAILTIEEEVTMRKDYTITVAATSILGGRHLQIKEGSPDEPELDNDTLFHGEPPYDLIGDAAELVNAVKQELIDGGVLSNLKSASEQLDQIATGLAEGKGTLGRLLADDDTVYEDLSATVESIRKVAERLEQGEGTVGKLLAADDTVYEDLKATAGSLRTIAERLESGEGTIGKLLAPDTKMYEDLAASVESLRTVASRLEKGEGAVGRLLTDDELYVELKAAVIELRATIEDFRETAPVTTFTSVFFGAF